MLCEIRKGVLSQMVLDRLRGRSQEFNLDNVTFQSTVLVSLRDEAQRLNQLLLEKTCPFEGIVFDAVDRERDKVLDGAEAFALFKRETNLPETVCCVPGARVMYLNNRHLGRGISNGTCGLISRLCDRGCPEVVFPMVRGTVMSLLLDIKRGDGS